MMDKESTALKIKGTIKVNGAMEKLRDMEYQQTVKETDIKVCTLMM